jgi:Tfp pilus assembly protein PilZ
VRSPAEILTVSSGGLFLKTGLLLELGAQVELEFSHMDEELLTVRAQVTRIEPQTGTDEEIGLGLRYLNMDAKAWLRLEKHLIPQATDPSEAAADAFRAVGSTSQRFRVINQDTDLKIKHLLAEINALQNELAERLAELEDLLGGEKG